MSYFLTDLPIKNTIIDLMKPKKRKKIQQQQHLLTEQTHQPTTSTFPLTPYQTQLVFPKVAFTSTTQRFQTNSPKDALQTPGPGTYNLANSFNITSSSLSTKGYGNGFISTNQRFQDMNGKLHNETYLPGPCEYKKEHYNSLQHSVNTSLKGQSLYNSKPSYHFKSNNISPGPCSYNPNKINTESYSGESNFKSEMRRFKAMHFNGIPGPGTYYQDALYKQYKINNRNNTDESSYYFKEHTNSPKHSQDYHTEQMLDKEGSCVNRNENDKTQLQVHKGKVKQSELGVSMKAINKDMLVDVSKKGFIKHLKQTMLINDKHNLIKEYNKDDYVIVPNYKKKNLMILNTPRWKINKHEFKVPGPAYYKPLKVRNYQSFNALNGRFV